MRIRAEQIVAGLVVVAAPDPAPFHVGRVVVDELARDVVIVNADHDAPREQHARVLDFDDPVDVVDIRPAHVFDAELARILDGNA